MPGTRARRAREYRAWARSLELIGQSPTPANCVEYRKTTVEVPKLSLRISKLRNAELQNRNRELTDRTVR